MKEVFCQYCRQHKPSEGFKLVSDPTGRTHRRMCPSCQEARKRLRAAAKKGAA